MIKGVIGYKVLSYKDIEPILMQLRSHAMQYSGFVSAENLTIPGTPCQLGLLQIRYYAPRIPSITSSRF